MWNRLIAVACGLSAITAIVAYRMPWNAVTNGWGNLACLGAHGRCDGTEHSITTGVDEAGVAPEVLFGFGVVAAIVAATHPTRPVRICAGIAIASAVTGSLAIVVCRTFLSHLLETAESLPAGDVSSLASLATLGFGIVLIVKRAPPDLAGDSRRG